MGNSLGKNLEGKHVFLSEKYCNDEERENPLYRVYLAKWGNGCSPNTIGSAVFATQLATQIEIRLEGHMLERFATKKEVKAAKQLFETDPPRDKLFTADDVKWDENGRPEVTLNQKFTYPAGLKFVGEEIDMEGRVIFSTMTFEGVMNSYLGFTIRDITYAIDKKQDVDVKKIRKHMIEFAKGWLGSILGLHQTPIELTIDLDTLTPEKREEFIKNDKRLSEYFEKPPKER